MASLVGGRDKSQRLPLLCCHRAEIDRGSASQKGPVWARARLLSALGLARDDAACRVVPSTSRALPPAPAGSETVPSEVKGWPGKWALDLPRWSSLGVSGCEDCGSPRTRGPEQVVSVAAQAWANLARRWPALRRAPAGATGVQSQEQPRAPPGWPSPHHFLPGLSELFTASRPLAFQSPPRRSTHTAGSHCPRLTQNLQLSSGHKTPHIPCCCPGLSSSARECRPRAGARRHGPCLTLQLPRQGSPSAPRSREFLLGSDHSRGARGWTWKVSTVEAA